MERTNDYNNNSKTQEERKKSEKTTNSNRNYKMKLSLFGHGGIIPLTIVELVIFTLFICTVIFPMLLVLFLMAGEYYYFLAGLLLIVLTNIDPRPKFGGAKVPHLRKSTERFWKLFSSYFSGELIIENEDSFKPVESSPVIFCIHPHGIVGLGVWANLVSSTDDEHFTSKLPQLKQSRFVTLGLNFRYPIWSQILTSLGFISSSRTSIRSALQKGHSVGIVIGGAAESLHAHPSSPEISLTIQSRRGFIREALHAGAPLVPIFTFGEVDTFNVYAPPEGTLLFRFQRYFKRVFGFATPFVTALWPKPVPLITVIGPPLVFPVISHPTNDELDLFHAKYLDHLKQFYSRNQFLDPVNSSRSLVFH